ncbi:MAG: hypothetical protein K2G81_06795 [Muribaculaceae bacterium]|nr:hypothetical protein [Muribaculaceae bacterium]
MPPERFSAQMEEENARRLALRNAPRPDPTAPKSGLSAQERFADDFEFWAATCVKIKDKLSGRLVPFVLNRAQRRVLSLLERQRRGGEPIRLIMLKARQWGGSTLIQIYMAWIQMIHAENWHSLICAHVKDTAGTIRGIYSTLLENYPLCHTPTDPATGKPAAMKFAPFEGARNVRAIAHRGCRVSICSSENPEAVRGGDYAMAHLSEVAFWNDTPTRTPEQLIRAICGSVARAPLTLIVMESTANGPGNYFHREWLRATTGRGSDKIPVFVPWHEIDIYSEELHCSPAELWAELDEYERGFWQEGLTLEQIHWYHRKRMEYSTHQQMMAEYPSTALEAFANSVAPVFSPARVESLRGGVTAPAVCGELRGAAITGAEALRDLRLDESPAGGLEVWQMPCRPAEAVMRPQYVVAVDVGGLSAASDWSVIAVARTEPGGGLEIVAQWRGHADHDILAWKAAAIARWYGDALLVVESNTLESHGEYVLEKISRHYRNLYRRTALATATQMPDARFGFHTNVATKAAALADLNAALRDGLLRERSAVAVDEFATYVCRPDGSQGAAPGCHDDVLMTRAIMATVVATDPPRRHRPLR